MASQRGILSINLTPALYNLQVKRDDKGIPLALVQQDMAQLSRCINGFAPVFMDIEPFSVPALNEH